MQVATRSLLEAVIDPNAHRGARGNEGESGGLGRKIGNALTSCRADGIGVACGLDRVARMQHFRFEACSAKGMFNAYPVSESGKRARPTRSEWARMRPEGWIVFCVFAQVGLGDRITAGHVNHRLARGNANSTANAGGPLVVCGPLENRHWISRL